MKIIVIGAGAWGTALAASAVQSGHMVSLLARDAQQASQINALRMNARYLPGIALPPELRIAPGDAQSLAFEVASAASGQLECAAPDLIIIATPMAGLQSSLFALRGCSVPVAWLCKGLDENGQLGHEIYAQAAHDLIASSAQCDGFKPHAAGVLSGPSFAQEVARGQPTALVAASADAAVRDVLVRAFHGERLRVYASCDVIGVEVGGAVKNVLAIATGLCDGLQLGLNARAALITRGLAEMTRLGLALGAQAETFMGLSGLGDLVLTATGDLSRNRQVGLLLAQGMSADQATESLGHVAEGVRCASAVLARARTLGVEMPITACVVALLAGQITALQAVTLLMGREPSREA